MSGSVSDRNDIDHIKSLISFQELFQELLPDHFQQSGNSHCPFHDDRVPSMQLKRDKGICYGSCAEKGKTKSYDIFDIFMKSRDVDFAAAHRELASKCSLPMGIEKRPSAPIVATYDYTDENENLLFQVLRYEPKGFKQRRPDVNRGWIWNLNGVGRVLYRLPDILNSSLDNPIWFAEGEKAVNALRELGLTATCCPGGANKFSKLCDEYSIHEALRDRPVYIMPDNDDAGLRDAHEKAGILGDVAEEVKIVFLPGLPEKGDVYDFIQIHGAQTAKSLLLDLSHEAKVFDGLPKDSDTQEAKKPVRKTKFEKLLDILAETEVEFFHDQFKKSWACISVNGHRENLALRSERFRTFLARIYYRATGYNCGRDAIQQALELCQSRAQFDGEKRSLSNRTAWSDGKILIDMGTDDWSAIEITESRWRIVRLQQPPFRRFVHMKPLPLPAQGGSIQEVLLFLTLRDEGSKVLICIWLPSMLIPEIPRPCLIFHGLQGSGKTFSGELLRGLVDPSATPTLNLPKDNTELVRILDHHALPVFDNLSSLPRTASDTLCRAVSGCGFVKRELYTDDDDIPYFFNRSFILNGISLCATEPDLLDRSLILELGRISPTERKSKKTLLAAYDRARPRIFGAMLDALSAGMRIKSDIKIDELPRLADWGEWAASIAEALGLGSASFFSRFRANVARQHMEVNQSQPVAQAVFELLQDTEVWTGTPTQLFEALSAIGRDRGYYREPQWPKAPNALTRKLNALAHNLSAEGVEFTEDTHVKPKRITLRKQPVHVTANTGKPGISGECPDYEGLSRSLCLSEGNRYSVHSIQDSDNPPIPDSSLADGIESAEIIEKDKGLGSMPNLAVPDIRDISGVSAGPRNSAQNPVDTKSNSQRCPESS
jgi:CHC2-type zinc finger protein